MLPATLDAVGDATDFPAAQRVPLPEADRRQRRPSNRQVDEIAEKFPNLTLLSTGDKAGQLRAIDEALRLVDTPYVFYSEDDFKLAQGGLITMNIQQLEQDPKLLQMWNGLHFRNFLNGTNIVDSSYFWGGFSFQPSVWRVSDYRLIEGGFANLTKDVSRAWEQESRK